MEGIEAIKLLYERYKEIENMSDEEIFKEVVKIIKNSPQEFITVEPPTVTFVPEIVYCRDCIHRPRKHWEGDEYEIVAPKNQKGKNDYTCYCSWLHIIPGDSFYCGFGEKNNV
jgi:hypothetical protein